jgi:L,D-transpeptidase catalytic domain
MYCVGVAALNVPSISRQRGAWLRLSVIAAVAAAVLLASVIYASANVVITVDKSTQRLSVAVDGAPRYEWPVSTARWGYHTPNGTYRPQRLERKWYSRKYDMSPMPYSIFFAGGYAIHGSYEISHIGRPASHGCIRLHPANAAVLFRLVERNVDDTRIVVTGERPSREIEVRRPPHHVRWVEAEPSSHLARSHRHNHTHYARAHRQRKAFEEVFTDAPPTETVPEEDYYAVRRGW